MTTISLLNLWEKKLKNNVKRWKNLVGEIFSIFLLAPSHWPPMEKVNIRIFLIPKIIVLSSLVSSSIVNIYLGGINFLNIYLNIYLGGIKNVKDALREISLIAHLLHNQLEMIWSLSIKRRKNWSENLNI